MLTVATAKAVLNITTAADDDLLDGLCKAAGAFAESFCGRAFQAGTFPETHPGGGHYVFLAHYPASAVTVAGVDPAGYRVYGERGVVEAVGRPFPRGELAVLVTVPAGAVPPAAVRACAELVGHWYREAKTHALAGHLNVAAVTPAGAGAPAAVPWGQATGYRVPPAVVDALRRFRVPAV